MAEPFDQFYCPFIADFKFIEPFQAVHDKTNNKKGRNPYIFLFLFGRVHQTVTALKNKTREIQRFLRPSTDFKTMRFMSLF